MFFGVVFVVLYAIPLVLAQPLEHVPDVPLAVAVLSACIAIAGLVARLNMPRGRLHQSAVGLYVLILLSLALLVANNGLDSMFIGLIAAAALCSGYFRAAGIILALMAVNAVIAYDYVTNGTASLTLLSMILTFNLPIILGGIIFYRIEAVHSEATDEDRSYHELATQLSQVSGKSDVVINAIADGVIAINHSGVIELINPAAQNLIGWGRQDALGLDYKSVLKLVDAKNEAPSESLDPIARALSSNHQEATDAFSLITNSGKKLLVALTVSPVAQNGSGVIIVFRDITSERAEERQQAEFISTASHEMRTPVASIEGYLGLVLNPATATIDEKARDFVSKAHAAAQHLGRLFQDLLDVSKAEDGRLKSSPRVVDVVPFIEEIFDGLAPKAAEKGLRFIFKPSLEDNATRDQRGKLIARNLSPVYYANVDNDHLREVVGNLIENAIKYTPSGEVVVDIDGTDDNISISITDTGLGIPKEDQAHLFQKFYRVDNSDTREIGGTGLGLYLCRRLAEAMGGRIWLESEHKKGSTFYLEIPRISHTEATKIIEDASMRAAIAQTEAADDTEQAFPPVAPDPMPMPIPVIHSAAPHQYVAAPESPPDTFQSHTTQPQPIVTEPRPNTPLSVIESDPSRYLQPRPRDITIPRRSQ